MHRSAFLRIALLVLGCSMGLVQAQGFPNKTITVISGYSPGAPSDNLTRVVATALSERIKQPVVVVSRTGAGGIVALSALKQSAADGYTIGVLVSANAVQPWLVKNLPYDVLKDFVPITNLYSVPLVMTVPVTLPVRNLQEFVAYGKANPGKVFYGSVGTGSTSHLSGELLARAAGFTMTNVPYKGAPEKNAALLAGDIHTAFDNYSAPKAMVEAGRLRAIAVTSKERWPTLPNLPTIAESYPGYEVTAWVGFAAPQGIPRDVLDKLATELRAVINAPAVRKAIADTGVDPGGMTPADYSKMLAAEVTKWGEVVRAAGMQPQ